MYRRNQYTAPLPPQVITHPPIAHPLFLVEVFAQGSANSHSRLKTSNKRTDKICPQ